MEREYRNKREDLLLWWLNFLKEFATGSLKTKLRIIWRGILPCMVLLLPFILGGMLFVWFLFRPFYLKEAIPISSKAQAIKILEKRRNKEMRNLLKLMRSKKVSEISRNVLKYIIEKYNVGTEVGRKAREIWKKKEGVYYPHTRIEVIYKENLRKLREKRKKQEP